MYLISNSRNWGYYKVYNFNTAVNYLLKYVNTFTAEAMVNECNITGISEHSDRYTGKTVIAKI